jgi:flagellar basal-body rod modification protein FlgD
MTTTAATGASNSAILDSLTGSSSAKASEGSQDRFLKLLVTQMQNQDPLNPMDNAQVTSQIAQINTVTGIDKLNTSVTSLGDRLVGAQSMQASAMIGRHVQIAGKTIEYDGTAVPLTFDLDARAVSVTVSVLDKGGQTLFTKELSNTEAGHIDLPWDGSLDNGGKAGPGNYVLKVEALDAKQAAVKATTYSYARVDSVSLDNGVTVNTKALGAIAVDDVKAII